ncbi:hypothetical protein CH341_12120 [Rhodoplanes roseus]|uniref:Prenyltransferase n=2 Tax=Rhodoplanes roseus TaxID=29409 RepID=A0A327L858_9BRAD|nr:hypothetical protein CH341_12120 [Rhodoplanes roseus]
MSGASGRWRASGLSRVFGIVRPLLRLLSCIRFDEVLVLQGAPLIGAVLAMDGLTLGNIAKVAVLVTGNCCLVAHVVVLNDWSGMHGDLNDPNRAAGVFMTKGIGRTELGCLCVALLGLALALFGALGATTFVLASAIAVLSALYSAPAFHMKGLPLANSGLHLFGGLLHFLLGYAVFSAPDMRSVAVGCFFALVFAAGHLTHETRDREADLLNGIRTNAVSFGRTNSFLAGFALFTIADCLLIALAVQGAVPRILAGVALLYPLHLYWTIRALREGLGFESVRRLQGRYRALYGVIGLTLLSAAVLGR